MTTDTIVAAATGSHIRPTQLVSGTFVTTDLKRTRRMCEELLGLECVEPEMGVLLVRENGHQPGGPLAGKPYWVLEAGGILDRDAAGDAQPLGRVHIEPGRGRRRV